MSTRRLVFWITILSVFAMAARISMDTDSWWHLRAGEWIYSNKVILKQDLFSYTRFGAEWNYPGWLIQIPMYLIFRQFGPGGLNIWTAVMVAIAFSFVWGILKGGIFLRAFLLVLAAASSGVYWSARPHLVTFVLAAASLYILEKYSQPGGKFNQANLFWLPFIMLLWVNSHGGFMVGFILWGIYWISEQASWILQKPRIMRYSSMLKNPKILFQDHDFRLTLVGLLMIIAVIFNPAGIRMFAYPFSTLGIEAVQDFIQEWQSPDFHSLSVQPFLWLVFLGFGAVGVSRLRLSLKELLLFTVFGYMGFMAGRNIALFSLTAPLVISAHLEPVLSSLKPSWLQTNRGTEGTQYERRKLNLVVLGFIILAVIFKVMLVIPNSANQKEFEKYLPIRAVTALNQNDWSGPIFNSYNWGGYLLWEARDFPVFIDGRTDLYNDEIIQKWLTVVHVKDGWEGILDSYLVNLVLNESGSALALALMDSDQWIKVYEDDVAVIFTRQELKHD